MFCMCVCVCMFRYVCVCLYIYIYIYKTYIHTHTHIYIYIYIYHVWLYTLSNIDYFIAMIIGFTKPLNLFSNLNDRYLDKKYLITNIP